MLSVYLVMWLLYYSFSFTYLSATVHDTWNWTKNVSPSKTAGESLENRGTDISRSTICLAKFARLFWALLMVLGFLRHRNTRTTVYYRVTREMLHTKYFSRDMPWVTHARHCPFSSVVYCIHQSDQAITVVSPMYNQCPEILGSHPYIQQGCSTVYNHVSIARVKLSAASHSDVQHTESLQTIRHYVMRPTKWYNCSSINKGPNTEIK